MYSKKGFSLATVMITGTVMMVVLAFTIGSIYVSGSSLSNQHNQLIARQAAESGIARAQACIIRNSKNITWTSTNPLRPNTDCFGNTISGMSEYIYNDGKTRSTYLVNPSDVVEEFKNVAAVGKLEFLKPNSEIWKTYDHRLSAYIHTGLTFDEVVFGSLYVGSGINDLYNRQQQKAGFMSAVYFFTKTNLGSISGVGYNIDGALTGFNSIQSLDFNNKNNLTPKEWYQTPYKLPNPSGNTVPIKRIFTDFQGNGWMVFFLGIDGRTVYSTGSNINCDLGTGYCDSGVNTAASRPIWFLGESKMHMANIPSNEKITNIYTNSTTYVLTDAGRLYGNGVIEYGPGLGYYLRTKYDSTYRDRYGNLYRRIHSPKRITSDDTDFNNYPIIKFYTDSHYDKDKGRIAIAVNAKGQLFAWGNGYNLTEVPKKILDSTRTGGLKIIDAVTDGTTIWALDSNGGLWSYGDNKYGQLGRVVTDSYDNNFAKVVVPDNEKITKIVADGFSALFLSDKGNVYGVGLNNVNQLGFPKDETCSYVEKVCSINWLGFQQCYNVTRQNSCSSKLKKYILPNGVTSKDIFIVSPSIIGSKEVYEQKADYSRNSYVITQSGEVYGAGSNKYGQLGVGAPGDNEMSAGGTPQQFTIPQKMILKNSNSDSQITGEENKPVVATQVYSGLGTTIVITEGNFVFTVGNNNFGQLGSGDQVEYHVPKRHRYTNLNKIWYY